MVNEPQPDRNAAPDRNAPIVRAIVAFWRMTGRMVEYLDAAVLITAILVLPVAGIGWLIGFRPSPELWGFMGVGAVIWVVSFAALLRALARRGLL